MEVRTELINRLPEFLRDIREYKALMQVEDIYINLLWNGVENALKEQTVEEATEYGISRLEKILKIVPKDFDEKARRLEIMTRLAKRLPYTPDSLRKILTDLCGQEGENFTLDIIPEKYVVKVGLNLLNKNDKDSVYEMIRQICPVNMLCNIEVFYNTYNVLSKYTHAQLGNLTYRDLTESILEEIID